MTKSTCNAVLLAANLLMITPGAVAELGDPAPALQVAEWIKGEPVVLADGKGENVYVVELWATTCEYSRRSIPDLTALQNKYQDRNVIVVAISCEAPDVVKEFVEAQGAKMDYRVAVDKEMATFRAYGGGFSVPNTPWAFLVDKAGNVVWHGHPQYRLDKTVADLLNGTYDIESKKRAEEARLLMPRYIGMVCSPSRAAEAGEIGKKIIEYGGNDPWLMNQFAWTVLDKPGLIKRDLELAMRAAKLAYDAIGDKRADVLDTYARALFDTGKKNEAVEQQKRAVEIAETPAQRAEMEETLAKYKKAVGDD